MQSSLNKFLPKLISSNFLLNKSIWQKASKHFSVKLLLYKLNILIVLFFSKFSKICIAASSPNKSPRKHSPSNFEFFINLFIKFFSLMKISA